MILWRSPEIVIFVRLSIFQAAEDRLCAFVSRNDFKKAIPIDNGTAIKGMSYNANNWDAFVAALAPIGTVKKMTSEETKKQLEYDLDFKRRRICSVSKNSIDSMVLGDIFYDDIGVQQC